MSSNLRDRLSMMPASADPSVVLRPSMMEPESRAYQAMKLRLHRQLLDRVDLAALGGLRESDQRRRLATVTQGLIDEEGLALSEAERKQLVVDVQDEVIGLGPLEGLMSDPHVSDILINTHKRVYVERRGRLELTGITFADDAHLMRLIDRVVSRVGRRIDESSPMVDARLPDGSRVNVIIPPLALDGPMMSIRRFAVDPLRMEDLIRNKALLPETAALLEGIVKARLNVVISGGTGSGKTTLLNILSGFIPEAERVITIEDAAELQMRQPHVVRLETRPPNIEGKGQVGARQLVRNSLRMRPDRIVVGEIRGDEVIDMLQAMNTGHDGSMTTLHANSPRDALARMENMLNMAGSNIPVRSARQQMSSAIQVIMQLSRLSDGTRRLTSLQEVTGMEGETVSMQEIFAFEQTGVNPDGTIKGRFRSTGIRPRFVERLQAYGFDVPKDVFQPGSRDF
jgi:pilus assembly protein CpaF